MSTPVKKDFSNNLLDTLAQKGTRLAEGVLSLGEYVSGKGALLSNNNQIRSWAQKKIITQSMMIKLIEIANDRDAKDRVKGYRNTFYCLNNVKSFEGRMYGDFCKNRFCPLCCGNRKAELIRKYFPVVSKWKDPYFLTLTVLSSSAKYLSKLVDEMYELFYRIKKKFIMRKNRGTWKIILIGIKSIEINFNPVARTYNPHFHILLPDFITMDNLRDEWIREATKKWGKRSINPVAQHFRKVKNVESQLIEIIKYSTKIFTSPEVDRTKKPKRGNYKIYLKAFDTIIATLQGRRIFERFGFDLPKDKGQKETKLLGSHMEWKFCPEFGDWIDFDSGLPLSGHVPNHELETTLNNCMDVELF